MISFTKTCDICHDKIGLYQPWYSIKVTGKLAIPDLKANPMCLCPGCFHAYQDFLVEREVLANHERNYKDIKRGGINT